MASIPEKALAIKGEAQGHHAGVGHVSSMGNLIATFLALVVLTVITVAVAQIDLGRSANLWIALFVALIKASIVVLFFMHLRYDKLINAVVLISSFLFVILFIGFAMTDSAEYQSEINRDTWVDLTSGGASNTP